MKHDDALPALPIGEAEVLWHEPDPVMPERPGKIIDASHAFMDAAPLGTRLYSAEQMHAYARAALAARAEPPVPDGVWEALQRLIENAGAAGPASTEDALLVARYRRRLLAARAEPVAWAVAVDGAVDSDFVYDSHAGASQATDYFRAHPKGRAGPFTVVPLYAAPTALPPGAREAMHEALHALSWLRTVVKAEGDVKIAQSAIDALRPWLREGEET